MRSGRTGRTSSGQCNQPLPPCSLPYLLHLQLMRTIGQCRLAKASVTPPPLAGLCSQPCERLVRLSLNCHHIRRSRRRRGSRQWVLQCNCFSDWYSVSSTGTLRIRRVAAAAAAAKQQLRYPARDSIYVSISISVCSISAAPARLEPSVSQTRSRPRPPSASCAFWATFLRLHFHLALGTSIIRPASPRLVSSCLA